MRKDSAELFRKNSAKIMKLATGTALTADINGSITAFAAANRADRAAVTVPMTAPAIKPAPIRRKEFKTVRINEASVQSSKSLFTAAIGVTRIIRLFMSLHR